MNYSLELKNALSDDWSIRNKFLGGVETASMNETELAEYVRKKGCYIEQIKAWKDACMNVNGEVSRLDRELKDSKKERRKLEKELQRKEKALAEAALLVLSKKQIQFGGIQRTND